MRKKTSKSDSRLTIVLFMTFGMSLQRWQEIGILSRELQVYKKMAEDDMRIIIVTYGDSRDLELSPDNNITILPIYLNKKIPSFKFIHYIHSFLTPFRLRKKLKHADIFLSNQMWGAWLPAISKLLFRKPFILRCGAEYYHNALKNVTSKTKLFIIRRLSSFLYKYADSIIMTSDYSAKFATKQFKIDAKKISIIGNCIDCTQFAPEPKIEKYRDRVLWVGRLSNEKNPLFFINAMHKSGIGADLVGTGPKRDEIDRWLDRNPNADIKLLGTVANFQLPELMNRYKYFAITSDYEGNPKALLEAMSCGVIAIGADVCGINSIIKKNNNGILYKVKNSDDFHRELKAIINDQQLQKKISSNARKTVQVHYSLDVVKEKFANLFHEQAHPKR